MKQYVVWINFVVVKLRFIYNRCRVTCAHNFFILTKLPYDTKVFGLLIFCHLSWSLLKIILHVKKKQQKKKKKQKQKQKKRKLNQPLLGVLITGVWLLICLYFIRSNVRFWCKCKLLNETCAGIEQNLNPLKVAVSLLWLSINKEIVKILP